jgi:hypothetical protein
MGKTKTLKQIAIDACNGADLETEDVWDNVASAVRKAVLEEAIEAISRLGIDEVRKGSGASIAIFSIKAEEALKRLMGEE